MIQSKSIVFIVDGYPSQNRPVYVFIEQLVEQLVDLGQQISVIAPQSLTHSFIRKISLEPKSEIRVTKCGNQYYLYRPYYISFGNHLKWLNNAIISIKKHNINNLLGKINPDIIYAHFWHNILPVLEYTEKRKCPIFVACGEGDSALEEFTDNVSSYKSKIRELVNGVISVSSENQRKCLAYKLVDKDKISVFPNCVDTSIFYPHRNTLKRKELGLTDDDFLIIFIGSFNYRKGANRVAQAISLLNDNKIKSIFIGQSFANDDYSPVCEGIIYKGLLNHKDISDYLSCADAFVLPTLKEGCSNAIVEALASGIPVISSRGEFNDDILDESNSLRIDPLNINQIANAIKVLKNDTELRFRLRDNMKNDYKKYSIRKRAQKILQYMMNKI